MNIFKKQGVAWCVTAVMIVIAIAVGTGKARTTAAGPVDRDPVPTQSPVQQVDRFYVYDEADILSDRAEEELTQRNLELYNELDVLIAVVTCNEGGDIYDVALDRADAIGLSGKDFIVVIDMTGQQYILVQGADLVRLFSDSKCDDYAYQYMQDHLDRGDYDSAVLELTEALEDWYFDKF